MFAKVAKVIVRGSIEGTAESEDHFGFLAARIGRVSTGGVNLPLRSTLPDIIELGTHADFLAKER